ncbi:hypothetical protein [Winogradskyella forsetii]|uniref:hypothetical protein n=1 Tax=Winogradskyella forsetii TaxID=2686077 RepID=UPI0015BA5354|nr:hypothetical protein [Winogradskyella forsetii]
MKIKSFFLDELTLSYIDYIKFRGESDEEHEKLTIAALKKYLRSDGIIKEIDAFGFKSNKVYLKSTGYYFSNAVNYPFDCEFQGALNNIKLYQTKSINDYFNSTVFLRSLNNSNHPSIDFNSAFKFLPESKKMSAHKELITLITKLELNIITEDQVIDFVFNQFKLGIEDFIVQNSFEDNQPKGSSHEFGYWLNYLIDFYEISQNTEFKEKLKGYFEKLHTVFVRKKMFYHDVVGKNRKCINVSGVILIGKAFLRYSIIEKDFRFTNASLFLIDFIKQLQLRNSGLIQNTFPIYRGNSKMKFPSWTLNYFLELLILKKQALHEFEISVTN